MTEKNTLHPTLKARVLQLARKDKADAESLERAARAMVLCPPDCPARLERFPEEHAHTYWDMLQAAPRLDYGWQCQQRLRQQEDVSKLDVTPHLRRAGVGDVHLRGLQSLDSTMMAPRAVRRWLEQRRPLEGGRPGPMPRPWLALLGVTNTGKTQAAVLVLQHFIRHHPWNAQPGGGAGDGYRPFVLLTASDLASTARQLADFAAGRAAREREEEMRRARVLVLDDLGAERLSPEALGLLHAVVNHRYTSRAVTVFTANMTPEVFETRLDFAGERPAGEVEGRLMRRIRELAAVVELSKKSGRMTVGGKDVKL